MAGVEPHGVVVRRPAGGRHPRHRHGHDPQGATHPRRGAARRPHRKHGRRDRQREGEHRAGHRHREGESARRPVRGGAVLRLRGPGSGVRAVQDLTGDATAVIAAVDSSTLCDGGDWPEAQLNALWEIGNGAHHLPARLLPDRGVVRRRPRPRPQRRPHRGRRHPASRTRRSRSWLSVGDERPRRLGPGHPDHDRHRRQPAHRRRDRPGGRQDPRGPHQPRRHRRRRRPACDPGLTHAHRAVGPDRHQWRHRHLRATIQVDTAATQGTRTCRVGFTLDGEPGGRDFVQTVHVNLNAT